ncbi:MAG: hypothetical protein WDN23_14240 [Edaphobacter sp.]
MRRTRWLGFALLCVLSATSWVIPQTAAGTLPPLEEQGLLFGLIGVAGLVFSIRGKWRREKVADYLRVAVGGLGFFGVPLVVAEYAGSTVSAITRSALFAFAPVVVVIAVAASEVSAGDERDARKFLIPALGGAGGLLLLLPLQFSRSPRGQLLLGLVCAAVVLVGVVSVRLHRLLREVNLAEAIAVVGLANAVFLLAWSALREEMVWRWPDLLAAAPVSSLVDGIEVLLLIWLLRAMAPMRFSARYLVIPFVTILESFALEQPEPTVRMICGTILLAAGAGVLLFLRTTDDEAVLSLR